MFYFHCIAIVFLFIFTVTFFGCDENLNPVNNGVNVTHKDTSIFIGTWVSVFDTSSNDIYGSKRDKKMIWCFGGECSSPDTFSYVNDTLYVNNTTGFEYYYTYDKDSIYYYSHLVGTGERVYEGSSPYYLSNDTLIFSPDTIRIDPDIYTCTIINIRTSNTPIKPIY